MVDMGVDLQVFGGIVQGSCKARREQMRTNIFRDGSFWNRNSDQVAYAKKILRTYGHTPTSAE